MCLACAVPAAAGPPDPPELPSELTTPEAAAIEAEGSLLAQSDFLETRLEHVRFHDCDLSGADFRGARLQACELRRCDLSGVEHVSGLRGASLEWPYIVELAGVWAAELGIGVLDQDEVDS